MMLRFLQGPVRRSLAKQTVSRLVTGTPSLFWRGFRSTIFDPTPEHAELRQRTRHFFETETLADDQVERFNIELFQKAGEAGLLGITVDKKYGGLGLDATAAVIQCEEGGMVDPGFGMAAMVQFCVFAHNLEMNGTEEQCQRLLPGACAGTVLGGMAMSEPECSTDVLAMNTQAVKQGEHYVLNGEKMWITNGCRNDDELGDAVLCYARTGKKKVAISSFLVEKGMPGFTLVRRLKQKCGTRASCQAHMKFDNVKLPLANLVGQENGAVLSMMRNLEIERLSLAGGALGLAQRCIQIMNEFARERRAFGQTINQFGQIQRFIAESFAKWQAARALVYQTAESMNLNTGGNRVLSDACKLFASNMAQEVADNAIQVLGGRGYLGENEVERLWRDSRIFRIGGGTDEALQKNMCNDLSKMDLNRHPRLDVGRAKIDQECSSMVVCRQLGYPGGEAGGERGPRLGGFVIES